MIEIQRILCPIDFSEFSRPALAHAVAIAGWYESSLALLHVWPFIPVVAIPPGSGVLPSPPTLSPEERGRLAADLKRLGEDAGADLSLDVAVVEGQTAVEILRVAGEMPADLVVMGSHGRSGFERLLLGSVTEKVVRKALCPVLTVPRPTSEAGPEAPALFKRIVCAIDFSDCSLHALHYAMSLAQEADARLILVHVIERPSTIGPGADDMAFPGPRSLQEYVAIAEQEARTRLEDVVPDEVRAYCKVDTVLATGKPYREILRVAAESQADLLVVGTHGRGAVDRMLFGSTTQHLVRQAACPVLTLREG